VRSSQSSPARLPEWQVPSSRLTQFFDRSSRSCVIIPVLNEGERIASLLSRIKELGISDTADIIIVDGGSTDGSLAKNLLTSQKVRSLITLDLKIGLSAQLRAAYAFSLIEGYEFIVTIDGNDKDDPAGIPKIIATLKSGVDFVQASRFVEGGEAINTPWTRTIAIRAIHSPLLSLASGFKWTDTTQGFRGYSRRLLEDSRLRIFRDVFVRYELLAYVSYRAPRLGFTCRELGTRRVYPDGKPPTKITSVRGNLMVFSTLLKACSGRFN
jgi:dolichol-phosphate mannosyltransferase